MSKQADKTNKAAKATKPKAAKIQQQTPLNSHLLQLAREDPARLTPTQRTHLQRTLGNRALGQLVGNPSSVNSNRSSVNGEQSSSPAHPVTLSPGHKTIQPKLTVNAVGDKYEQEADAVAKEVVQKLNTPQPDAATGTPAALPTHAQRQTEEEEPIAQRIQRQAAPEEGEMPLQRQETEDEELQLQRQELEEKEPQEMAMLQRETAPEEEELQLQRQELPKEEEMQLQRQALEEEDPAQLAMTRRQPQDFTHGGPVDSHIEAQINQSRGGRPMEDSIRQPMEQAFGADFSDVRIHTDAQAHALNEAIQARAFTTGSHIYFKEGEYSNSNSAGQSLLAHELTHTIQQSQNNLNTHTRNKPVNQIDRVIEVRPNEIPSQDIQYEFIAHVLAYKNKIPQDLNENLVNWGYLRGWQKVAFDTDTSFFAGLIMPHKSENLPVIAFRGTNDLIKDLLADAHPEAIGWNQFARNKIRILDLIDHAGGKVDLVGHSLGGALAQHTAITYPSNVGRVVTFQSPGISADAVKEYKKKKLQLNITHHFAKGDLVDLGGEEHLPGNFFEHDTSKYVTHDEQFWEAHQRLLFNRPDFREQLTNLNLNNVYKEEEQAFQVNPIKGYGEHPYWVKKFLASSARNNLGGKIWPFQSKNQSKHETSNQEDASAFSWSDVSEWVHGGLDVAGLFPVVGEVFDGINAAIYAAEGRYGEAAISAASMIPIWGDLGKVGKWSTKLGKEVSESVAEQGVKQTSKATRPKLLKQDKAGRWRDSRGRFAEPPASSPKKTKSHGPAFKKAKADFKRQSLDNPDLPNHIRGHLRREQKRKGNQADNWTNPPGYDVGHLVPGLDDPSNFRWEYSGMNRSRGGKYRR